MYGPMFSKHCLSLYSPEYDRIILPLVPKSDYPLLNIYYSMLS